MEVSEVTRAYYRIVHGRNPVTDFEDLTFSLNICTLPPPILCRLGGQTRTYYAHSAVRIVRARRVPIIFDGGDERFTDG